MPSFSRKSASRSGIISMMGRIEQLIALRDLVSHPEAQRLIGVALSVIEGRFSRLYLESEVERLKRVNDEIAATAELVVELVDD